MKDKLNLGCGRDIRKDFINVDFEKFSGVDVIHDLNKIPYPFKKESFNYILMRSILEHLDNPHKVLKEIHRISKPDAIVHIRTPHFSSNNVWSDIQHKRGYGLATFLNKPTSDLFKIISYKIEFSPYRFFIIPLARIAPIFYEKHLAYIFPATDLVVELKVKK